MFPYPTLHGTIYIIHVLFFCRCQLRKVLESRKTMLWKEQGMAFARATAAGFGMDHMENLILFAKSFGASRLL